MLGKQFCFGLGTPKSHLGSGYSYDKEDVPLYPLSVEEAQSLMFDVNKTLVVNEDQREKSGIGDIHAEIRVSWGRHDFTEPVELLAKSNSTRLD